MMKLNMRLSTPMILAAFIVSGCAAGRVADLKDCGTLSVGFGVGLDATAKAGCLLHPSVGVVGSYTRRVGLEHRDTPLLWEEAQCVWPIDYLIHQMGVGSTPKPPPFVSYSRYSRAHARGELESHHILFPPLVKERHGNPFAFHELTDIEVGATLLLVSARAGINPLELVDLVLGFVGIDIARDDPKKKDGEKPTTESTPTK